MIGQEPPGLNATSPPKWRFTLPQPLPQWRGVNKYRLYCLGQRLKEKKMSINRFIVIVLDSVGIGEGPDAAAFGDVGSGETAEED